MHMYIIPDVFIRRNCDIPLSIIHPDGSAGGGATIVSSVLFCIASRIFLNIIYDSVLVFVTIEYRGEIIVNEYPVYQYQ